MPRLHHSPLDAASRFVRLALAEMGVAAELVEERPWERRDALLGLNPAGEVPILIDDAGLAVPGAMVIADYLDESLGPGLADRRLMPADIEHRVEVRRLVDWFTRKFDAEVADYLVGEKLVKRYLRPEQGGGPPDTGAIRAAKANVRYHLAYVGYLAQRRNWLAGERLTYADLAAAASLSVVDYFGDVPWHEVEAAKGWYQRIKSRPSFRPLLQDVVRGMAPAEIYADLDF